MRTRNTTLDQPVSERRSTWRDSNEAVGQPRNPARADKELVNNGSWHLFLRPRYGSLSAIIISPPVYRHLKVGKRGLGLQSYMMPIMQIGGVLPKTMEQDAGRGYCYARRESNLKHVLCARNFLTCQPTGTPRRDISPGDGLLILSTFRNGVAEAALYCAHRATVIHLNDLSKLACFSLLEWHPCWSHCGRRASTF